MVRHILVPRIAHLQSEKLWYFNRLAAFLMLYGKKAHYKQGETMVSMYSDDPVYLIHAIELLAYHGLIRGEIRLTAVNRNDAVMCEETIRAGFDLKHWFFDHGFMEKADKPDFERADVRCELNSWKIQRYVEWYLSKLRNDAQTGKREILYSFNSQLSETTSRLRDWQEKHWSNEFIMDLTQRSIDHLWCLVHLEETGAVNTEIGRYGMFDTDMKYCKVSITEKGLRWLDGDPMKPVEYRNGEFYHDWRKLNLGVYMRLAEAILENHEPSIDTILEELDEYWSEQLNENSDYNRTMFKIARKGVRDNIYHLNKKIEKITWIHEFFTVKSSIARIRADELFIRGSM